MVLAWLGKGGPALSDVLGPLGGVSDRLLARAVTAECCSTVRFKHRARTSPVNRKDFITVLLFEVKLRL